MREKPRFIKYLLYILIQTPVFSQKKPEKSLRSRAASLTRLVPVFCPGRKLSLQVAPSRSFFLISANLDEDLFHAVLGEVFQNEGDFPVSFWRIEKCELKGDRGALDGRSLKHASQVRPVVSRRGVQAGCQIIDAVQLEEKGRKIIRPVFRHHDVVRISARLNSLEPMVCRAESNRTSLW